MNDYDRAHIRDILADREGSRFEWTNAHVLRFLDRMFRKSSNDLPKLWKIYPEQMTALMMDYGWSLFEMERRVRDWSIDNDR